MSAPSLTAPNPSNGAGWTPPAAMACAVPLVPRDILAHHAVHVPNDDRHTAACRMLAVLARGDLPAGTYTPAPHRARAATVSGGTTAPAKAVRLGSRLAPAAARAGANFLPGVVAHVRQALLFRQRGALFDEDRLYGNMLSSTAALMNLLAPLACDLDLATRVFRILLPRVHSVTGIAYEISPAREEQGRRGVTPAYLGDATAWDALVTIIDDQGREGWLAIEAKYVGMAGPAAAPRPRYAEAARVSGLYRDPEAAALRRPGLEQLMREHLLLDLSVRHGLADRATFVLLAPATNDRARAASRLYAEQLAPHDLETQPERVGYRMLTMEAVASAMAEAGAGAHAAAYSARYLDLGQVARFVLDRPMAMPTPTKHIVRRSVGQRGGAGQRPPGDDGMVPTPGQSDPAPRTARRARNAGGGSATPA